MSEERLSHMNRRWDSEQQMYMCAGRDNLVIGVHIVALGWSEGAGAVARGKL